MQHIHIVHNVHYVDIFCLLPLQVVNVVKVFDPYVAVDIDEIQVARTPTRQKTLSPVWNEEMNAKVHSGENINFTVFHDAAIPPDEFVANCKVPFEDIAGEKTSDIWVMLVTLNVLLSTTFLVFHLSLTWCITFVHLVRLYVNN